MADASLQIKIGADVQGAVANLGKFSESLDDISAASGEASKKIGSNLNNIAANLEYINSIPFELHTEEPAASLQYFREQLNSVIADLQNLDHPYSINVNTLSIDEAKAKLAQLIAEKEGLLIAAATPVFAAAGAGAAGAEAGALGAAGGTAVGEEAALAGIPKSVPVQVEPIVDFEPISVLEARLAALKEERLLLTDGGSIANINREIATTESGITRIKNIGKAGFDEFGEAVTAADSKSTAFLGTLQKQRVAFTDVGRAVTGQGFTLRTLASNFALLGPQIVIGAAALGFFTEYLLKESKAAKDAADANAQYLQTFGKVASASDSLETIKSKISEYNTIVKTSIEANAKESASVDELVNRLKAGNLTRNETVEVIQKLQKIAPDYFGKLDAEKASIDDITNSYNKYNTAIVATIEAQIKLSEITNLVKDRLSFEDQNKAASSYVNTLRAQGKSLDDIASIATKSYNDQSRGQIELLNSSKRISDEQLKQSTLGEKVPFGVQAIVNKLKEEEDLLNQIKNIPLKELGIDDKTITGIKALEIELGLLEQIKKASEDLRKPDKTPVFKKQELSTDREGDIDVTLLQDKIAKAIEEGAKAGTARAKSYAAELGLLYQQEINRIKNPELHAHIKFDLADPTAQGDTSGEIESTIEKAIGLKNGIKIKIPFNIDLQKEKAEGDPERLKAIDEVFKKLETSAEGLGPYEINPIFKIDLKAELDKQELQDKLQKVAKDAAQIANSTLGSLLDKIGSDIGSRNGFRNFGSQIEEILGEGLEALGKSLLTAFPIIQAAKIAIENAIYDPELVAAAGALAIVAGAAIKSIASRKGIGQFAEGGSVVGPGTGTSDSIPAFLSHGEFVVRAQAVKQPGALGLLQNINSGAVSPGALKFAEGGFVGASSSPVFNTSSVSNYARNYERGTDNIEISGKTITEGQHLVTIYNRAQKIIGMTT